MATCDLLEDFSDFVNENKGHGKHVLAFFIDFTKAFESINQLILLDRLDSIGMRSRTYDLFKNYLGDRWQVLWLGSKYTTENRVKQEVRQGTVLGALLFNLYVNEISQVKLNSKLFQFAN